MTKYYYSVEELQTWRNSKSLIELRDAIIEYFSIDTEEEDLEVYRTYTTYEEIEERLQRHDLTIMKHKELLEDDR